MKRRQFFALTGGAGATVLAVRSGMASAQQLQLRFFRIGTAATAGTYFPIGGLIANAISSPPGAKACGDAIPPCGVRGLVATAVATSGSVANIRSIASGAMESGFVQSDVSYWAHTGTGIYQGQPPVEALRLIANLYPESVHLVARKGAGIKSVADLAGKRVSLDEQGSGTLADAILVLDAFGVAAKDLKVEHLKANQASDRLKDGALDAFFSVSGYPLGAISELAATSPDVELVPISGPPVETLLSQHPFFVRNAIPDGVYRGVAGVETVAVGAQWVTSERQRADVIYEIVKALWSDNTRRMLDAGHSKGRLIRKETALDGAAIPLHPGAARFYRETGLLK